jgi:diguanylate cyclase (GGDEF)-like protein
MEALPTVLDGNRLDPLTGLPDRAHLEQQLDLELDLARTSGAPLVLLYVDLDDFKLVNDGLGHALGDNLLRIVAERLRAAVRSPDVLVRQGGDEFLILASRISARRGETAETAGRRAALAIAERIAEELSEPIRIGGAELLLEATVGASIFPVDGEDADTLRRHADAAMYDAKRRQLGFALYESGRGDPLEPLSLAAALRRAIDADELEMHYQPIFRLTTREPIGVEALVRWRRPDGVLVPPGDFVPAAERTGIIDALGEWILRRVCRDVAGWSGQGLFPHVGINVSPRQLRRGAFAERVTEIVAASGVRPDRIILEVTESAWSVEATRSVPSLQRLRDAGFALAIDDFGAGYSSLSRLRELPVQVIKVDRAFLRGVPEDPRANAVVAAMLQLAEAYGIDVVAEGIETAAQLEFLVARGCLLGQGFLLGRPMPAVDAGRVLAAHLAADRRPDDLALSG